MARSKLLAPFYEDLDNMRKALAESVDEYNEKQVEILKDIGKSAIKSFYASYTPEYYTKNFMEGKYGFRHNNDEQTEGLYRALNVRIQNGKVIFSTDADLLTDHLGNKKQDIVYGLAFENGYHGGSIWRKPLGIWKYPSKEAEQSESIKSLIQRGIDNYDFQSMFNKLVNKNISKYNN